MFKDVEHIFFDLDKTLWDFETNSTLALKELFIKYDLASKGISSFEEMHFIYKKINEKLWADYSKNLISKEDLRTERFNKTFEYFGLYNSELSFLIGLDYVKISPRKNNLYPGTIDTLEYLSKKYQLHIITNGFEEVQYIKLESSGIIHFFKQIITSEKAGAKKPDKAIFNFALHSANASPENSLMIGDDVEIDIQGALNAQMRAIHFNPDADNNSSSNSFYAINSLNKLLDWL